MTKPKLRACNASMARTFSIEVSGLHRPTAPVELPRCEANFWRRFPLLSQPEFFMVRDS